jgi:hypothetical protein
MYPDDKPSSRDRMLGFPPATEKVAGVTSHRELAG